MGRAHGAVARAEGITMRESRQNKLIRILEGQRRKALRSPRRELSSPIKALAEPMRTDEARKLAANLARCLHNLESEWARHVDIALGLEAPPRRHGRPAAPEQRRSTGTLVRGSARTGDIAEAGSVWTVGSGQTRKPGSHRA